MKKIAAWVLAAILVCFLPAQCLAGGAPYNTVILERGGARITQNAFLPTGKIDKFGSEELKQPQDITTKDGYMFIADTGNGRVLKCKLDGETVAVYGKGELKQPKGVHVSDSGLLYVADQLQKAVYVFDEEGNIVKKYTKPDSALYGPENDFAPKKVASDSSGNVYIVSEGGVNGIIQLSKEGDFFGYVGANSTSLTLREVLRRLTFTETQKAQLKLSVPSSPYNVCTDQRGLVYTVTQGAQDALKKFNLASVNMLSPTSGIDLLTDVCVSSTEGIFAVSQYGYITEYDRDGRLLFVFGGPDDGSNRSGLFVSAMGIALDDQENLYVLDSEQGSVTAFARTEFAAVMRQALFLYHEGLYLESQELWEYVLRGDALSVMGHAGLGEVWYKLGEYDKALEAFRFALSHNGYSESFWELRNEWLMNNLAYVILGILGLAILAKILKTTNRKTGFLKPVQARAEKVSNLKIPREFRFMARTFRNPADAFYGVRFENRVSVPSATLLYILFYLIYIAGKYCAGFLFKTVPEGHYELGTDFVLVFGVIAAVVICNNLVCSINDGEGKFRDIYAGLACCLTPYVFIKPILILLTHVLTDNERFIISFGGVFIGAAVLILVVAMVMEIQAYTLAQTAKILLLTLFTAAMLAVTLVIAWALVSQVADFVSALAREAYFRAG
ncbi:MAG: hypothetical protein LBC41_04490 [Clostridiales bacterium]|jgi:sugar lactone lactonase YvrE|nr:hypothetical protein [Clostridiales bacterium]